MLIIFWLIGMSDVCLLCALSVLAADLVKKDGCSKLQFIIASAYHKMLMVVLCTCAYYVLAHRHVICLSALCSVSVGC